MLCHRLVLVLRCLATRSASEPVTGNCPPSTHSPALRARIAVDLAKRSIDSNTKARINVTVEAIHLSRSTGALFRRLAPVKTHTPAMPSKPRAIAEGSGTDACPDRTELA